MFIKKWRKHLATALAVTMMVGASVTAYAAPEEASVPVVKIVEEQTDTTAMELAKSLVGEEVNIVSAKMEGDASSFGTFKSAETIVGFNEGFAMSTGHLKQGDITIFDDGYSAFFSSATNGKSFKGSEIEGFDPVQYFYDYTMLEFTFIPKDENVSFQYCVASEEYPEYINYFDQFVLLVNGVNYALVPNTNELVTIGTVNHLNNNVYYRGLDYSDGAPISEDSFVFDGITTTFSVSAKVNPGQENTIRVAIADKGDDIFDTVVFIKAGSVKEKEATPGEIVVGGVDGDTLTLDRVDGTDGFVGVDVTFEDINKEEISTESVTFNDGEDVKDVTIPEGTVYFYITATAGGVEVDKVVTESQKIESYEEVTALSISGKVVAVPDVFEAKDTVSGGDATVSGGDATVSGGDATVSGGDATTTPEEETSKDPEKVAYATVSLKGEGISRTTYSDEEGNYVFKNLKSGYYQITVTKAGKASSTVVKVDNSNVECNFEIFNGSSVINANNTGILVGGLNGLLGNDSPIFDATDKEVIKNGGSVNVEFNAGAATKSDVDALEAFAGKKFDKVYDLSIKKVAQNAAGEVQYTKSVSETGKLVTIVIPMPSNMKGMKDYKVYRLHEGETPEALTEVPNTNGEYIEVDQKEGVVIIHACKFSAYTSVVGEEVKEVTNNNANNNNANSNTNNSNAETRDDATSGSAVSPKTGESSSTIFWCMMAIMMAAAMLFTKKATKKN